MIDTVLVTNKINASFSSSGLDTLARCLNKEWFTQYPYTVNYNYNSRGFRDTEWPDSLADAIWCIGDSFTVGIGAPIEHTWPYLLAQATGICTVNISMDGASNDWISNMSNIVSKHITPRHIIHQWSYIHRRGSTQHTIQHYTDAIEQQDIENFISAVTKTQSNLAIHSMIPKFAPSADTVAALQKLRFQNVVYDNEQIDYARDYHHYDIITATKYVSHYMDLIK